ncbi:4'-phosphopantetheinyl transferase [Streptomyces sp. NPDC059917]|uniref:4'-phosphopantetheinyl transferase family protein n=1 Tax=Streptomyces sp. NPDC059917 TaxID=3347002 RepID=UPI00364DE0BE
MIELLLPSHVRSFDSFEDVPFSSLYPEEAALVRNSVEHRRREFATARYCAHRALAALGVPPAPLLATPRGTPLWPASVRGSITHATGYRAAVVADASRVAAVGIDAELDRPLPDGVLESIALPPERAQVRRHTALHPGINWGKVLFSAKECFYKAWFPQTSRELEFEDAHIRIDPLAGTFSARLLPPALVSAEPELSAVSGRWTVHDGVIVTAIVLDAPPSERDPRAHGPGRLRAPARSLS